MSSTGGERLAGIAALVALVITGCSSPAPAPSAPGTQPEQVCAEPQATASPSTAIRGEAITIEGVGWEACNDTPNDRTPETWSDLSLEWVQADETADLGDVTPVDGSFQHEITVPTDARSGRAVIRITAPEFSTEIPVSVTNG